MTVTRRQVIGGGGGVLAALVVGPAAGGAGDPVEIVMQGNDDGSHVWFDPVGVHVRPGQTIRWVNRDPGNSHTATAYHPEILDRPRRMPAKAKPWDSDYLLPDETFSMTLHEEGVYDYYCVPHEHAGMVGRIIVGEPKADGWMDARQDGDFEPVPEVALSAFPSVEKIMRDGIVRRT